jgi:hypothetical protein
MIVKRRLYLLFVLVLLCSLAPSKGQNRNDDVMKIRTRVVFIDTLVDDKKTGAPVADLKRENFEVLADGKPRTLSYFSRAREGHRRPLALILVVDLWARDANEDLRGQPYQKDIAINQTYTAPSTSPHTYALLYTCYSLIPFKTDTVFPTVSR